MVNSKVAEKIAARQERKKKLAEGMQAYDVVRKANEIEDPLTTLAAPFRKFQKNGVCIELETKRRQDLDDATFNQTVDLVEKNMKDLYEKSDGGWNLKAKRKEMAEDEARYLMAWDVADQENRTLVAVSHFRFDVDYDLEVLYCYELQLVESVRRKGLGRYMMLILELLSYKNLMKKVVLTCFKDNEEAVLFYRSIGYSEDDTNMENDESDTGYCDYLIMSKPTVPKSSS